MVFWRSRLLFLVLAVIFNAVLIDCYDSNEDEDDYHIENMESIHESVMSVATTIGVIVALIVGGLIVITIIICCCCCKGRRSQGHVYRQTPATTTTTIVTQQQRNQPPQYPAQAPGGYSGYQTPSPAPPGVQMAPPHQGASPGYNPQQNMVPGYPLQNQEAKVEPSAPPAPSAPYMQDMPYYPPPQDQSYPPPPSQPYPPQPYGGMVQPPPYSEK